MSSIVYGYMRMSNNDLCECQMLFMCECQMLNISLRRLPNTVDNTTLDYQAVGIVT